MNYKKLKLVGALIFLGCVNSAVLAQNIKESSNYTNRPIKIINPLAAGGAVDTMARLLAPALQDALGQPIIIESKPGAGGTIGSNFVAKSPPDGYTILMVYDTFAVNPHVYKNLPFDSFKNLTPVTELVKIPLLLVGGNKLPANNLRELAELSKTKAGGINYSSGGAGSSGHLAAELLKSNLGIDMTHVPYKGATQAAVGLAGNEVQAAFQGIATVNSLIKAGKLRPLAVFSATRSPALPDVPTMKEAGVPGLNFNSWAALLAPAGTPKEIVTKLYTEVSKIVATKEIQDRLAPCGAHGRREPFERRRLGPPHLGLAVAAGDVAFGRALWEQAVADAQNVPGVAAEVLCADVLHAALQLAAPPPQRVAPSVQPQAPPSLLIMPPSEPPPPSL